MKLGAPVLYLIVLFGLTSLSASYAKGDIPIVYSNDEMLVKVMQFPQTEDFVVEGKHVDLGYKYKQFSTFWVPLWNYDGQWCGYVDDETFVEVTESELREIVQSLNLTYPSAPQLPAWESWGGKLLAAGILLFFLRFLKSRFL